MLRRLFVAVVSSAADGPDMPDINALFDIGVGCGSIGLGESIRMVMNHTTDAFDRRPRLTQDMFLFLFLFLLVKDGKST